MITVIAWTFLLDVLVLFWVMVYVMVESTLTGKRPALFGGTRPVPEDSRRMAALQPKLPITHVAGNTLKQ